MAFTYSCIGCLQDLNAVGPAAKEVDLLELHIWMVQAYEGAFYKRVKYDYDRFDSKGYENVAAFARGLVSFGSRVMEKSAGK